MGVKEIYRGGLVVAHGAVRGALGAALRAHDERTAERAGEPRPHARDVDCWCDPTVTTEWEDGKLVDVIHHQLEAGDRHEALDDPPRPRPLRALLGWF